MLDKNFLKELDFQNNKTLYAKIILLTFDEEPVEEITGRITTGSLNIDGASAVRRTCSLTMTADETRIESLYWGIKNKFKLEIGVENNIDYINYPETIWFKQGVFVITSLNESFSASNHSISISGKDKGCLLNGEIGGTFTSSVDFGKLEVYNYTDNYNKVTINADQYIKDYYYIKDNEDGYKLSKDEFDPDPNVEYFEREQVREYEYLKISDIIKNMLNVYGREPLHNIIINDIEKFGLELLEYRGKVPMYLLKNVTTGLVVNATFDGDYEVYQDPNFAQSIALKHIPTTSLDHLVDQILTGGAKFYINGIREEQYTIIKLEFGDTAGYRKTDLTYPGDLIANVGETVVTILDKIKNMFSGFEYFYDVDGHFVFQKKKDYINNSWNPIQATSEEIENVGTSQELYVGNNTQSTEAEYTFENQILMTQFTNSPQLTNLKNDFSIWGKRKGIDGSELPVHLRYAIEFKPKFYRKLEPNKGEKIMVYYTKEFKESEAEIYENEIKQMVDWREIIYQMALDYFKFNHIRPDFEQMVAEANPEFYPIGKTNYEIYYTDMQAFWRQLYDSTVIQLDKEEAWVEKYDAILKQIRIYSSKTGWNKNILTQPETLNFWFDFLNANSFLGQYAVSLIGDRVKTVNDDKINAIYFRQVPSIIFISKEEKEEIIKEQYEAFLDMTGYTFIQLNQSLDNYFTVSAQGKSAWDELNSLLYLHTYYTQGMNLTTIPIYYLKPNTRIYIKNNNNVEKYVLNKITLPLTYNGTSSLSVTKIVERIVV